MRIMRTSSRNGMIYAKLWIEAKVFPHSSSLCILFCSEVLYSIEANVFFPQVMDMSGFFSDHDKVMYVFDALHGTFASILLE